jgi:LPS sulfotransferase NodH
VPKLTRAGAYLICGTPRTGSTLLCGLLRATGVAGRPESYFRRPDEQAWADRWRLPRGAGGSFDYRDYARAAVAEGSTANGIFGARVMWGTLEEMVAGLGVAHPEIAGDDLALLTTAFGPLRFVHIRREDTLAQAVSWARAEQTGHWQDGDPVAREPQFDADQIAALVRTVDAHNAAWRRWFAEVGVRAHVVRYEDLVTDMATVLRDVLAFLGLEPPPWHVVVPGHRRQADEVNAEWVARYRGRAGEVSG